MPSRPVSDPWRQSLPRWVVDRPDLERRLDDVAPGGLGVLVASAGSGKSVLVRQWLAARPHLRVAALAMTRRHVDAVALAKDLVATIATVAPRVEPDIDELVAASGSALGDAFVDRLLDRFAHLPADVVLVVEDAHVLSGRPVVEDLGRLLCALPRSVRAVVTTRRDLPWPLHRLRLGESLVEIRSADLAFREDQARALLENVSQRDLTDAQVHALVDRTDGWAVGLQLAAISLRTAPDVEDFVESFAGSDRLVAEYLLDEVIEQQEPEVRRFLLQTSVLEELTAPQCDAVTGSDDSLAMLTQLYRRSMFLVPLDTSGESFRYHHLFADVLRFRLELEYPGAVSQLRRRAARWLIQHGREEEAVGHLLDAGDADEAFRVVSSVGHRLLERGEATTLVRWLQAIARTGTDLPVAVYVNLLAAQLGAGDTASATETYRRIVRRAGLTLGEHTTADALYSLLVFRDLPPGAVLQITDRVGDSLSRLTPDEVPDFLGIGGLDSVRTVGEYAAGVAHFLAGDLDLAATTLEQARTLPGMSYPVWHVSVLGSLALVRAWQGHCTEALGLARSAIGEARSFGIARHHALGHAHLALALVHLDRVELDAAEHALAEVPTRTQAQAASGTYVDLQGAVTARMTAVREGPEEALRMLRTPAASGTEAPVLRDARRALRTRLLIGTGELGGARALVADASDGAQLAPARVDLALATGDVAGARVALDGWRPLPGDLRTVTRRLLREFAVLSAEGRRAAAEVALTEAVAAARGDRLRSPFLEVPAALHAVRRGVGQAPWLTGEALWDLAVTLEPAWRARTLVEPLTGRELTVLVYLPTRMRNHEIAADLYVSVNTVKTQLGSIYRKLGVTERNEAIARATELGLL